MALPFVAPPGIPEDRAAVLKHSFMAHGARRERFRAEMLKVGIMTSPIDGDAVRLCSGGRRQDSAGCAGALRQAAGGEVRRFP